MDWVTRAISTRNIAGLAEPQRHNLYPVDFDVLVERHALLGMTREELVAALPALRGNSTEKHGSLGPGSDGIRLQAQVPAT